MSVPVHAHPSNFRVHRVLDRGWGELAFEYRWDSTGGLPEESGCLPDLSDCFLYEITTYAENEGERRDGYLFPPDPPFVEWKFRDPTDGRSAPVGLERFSAAQGWAWDRHKLAGALILPPCQRLYTIEAVQQYRFHCEICCMDAPVPGLHSGPHSILRTFAPRTIHTGATCIWRYSIQKHGKTAWLEMDENGCRGDSAEIGFGPDWL